MRAFGLLFARRQTGKLGSNTRLVFVLGRAPLIYQLATGGCDFGTLDFLSQCAFDGVVRIEGKMLHPDRTCRVIELGLA